MNQQPRPQAATPPEPGDPTGSLTRLAQMFRHFDPAALWVLDAQGTVAAAYAGTTTPAGALPAWARPLLQLLHQEPIGLFNHGPSGGAAFLLRSTSGPHHGWLAGVLDPVRITPAIFRALQPTLGGCGDLALAAVCAWRQFEQAEARLNKVTGPRGLPAAARAPLTAVPGRAAAPAPPPTPTPTPTPAEPRRLFRMQPEPAPAADDTPAPLPMPAPTADDISALEQALQEMNQMIDLCQDARQPKRYEDDEPLPLKGYDEQI